MSYQQKKEENKRNMRERIEKGNPYVNNKMNEKELRRKSNSK